MTIISERMERMIGAASADTRDDAEKQTLMQCPPVNPHLIKHLRMMFSDPGRAAKPTNPLLGQLLTIQYGVEKVLNYLQAQYDGQSAEARKARGI